MSEAQVIRSRIVSVTQDIFDVQRTLQETLLNTAMELGKVHDLAEQLRRSAAWFFAFRFLSQRRERLAEAGEVDWFHEMQDEAGIAGTFEVVFHAVAAQGDAAQPMAVAQFLH